MPFLPFLHRAANRENLTAADAQSAMELILTGQASTAQITGFLIALRMKGETPDEILGFARAMRQRSTKVLPALNGEVLIDTCGTFTGRPYHA